MRANPVLPTLDIETHVPASITSVRRSRGWPGLFLQERRGHSGDVRYVGGPRQHVLYCFVKAARTEVLLGNQQHSVNYLAGESRFTPAGHQVSFRWKGE